MRCIISESHDPALCLAAEEFLLTNKTDGEWLMLWISDPSVIIGKFQNPYAEVSLTECERRGIGVFRRNSGGGTVYHDGGNVNYTIISGKSQNSPDYARFLTPIVDFLADLGAKADVVDTSALFIGDKKISGSAQSVVGERVMHHGTLLFDADLSVLGTLTGHAREKIVSKAIKSNPSPVTNIRPHLRKDMTVSEFVESLGCALADERYGFTADEYAKIMTLADEKYRTWDWIHGRSPAFSLAADGFEITSRHGVIESSSSLCDALVGARLIPSEIRERLLPLGSEDAEKITKILFD